MPGRSPCATHLTSPRSAGATASRPAKRPLRALHSELLGHLEVLSKNKSAAKSLLTHLSRRRRSKSWSRPATATIFRRYDKLTDFKTYAEEGPPKGTLLPLPRSVQAPDPVDRGFTRPAEGRPADLRPGHAVQHGRQVRPGREDGVGRWPGPRPRSKASCARKVAHETHRGCGPSKAAQPSDHSVRDHRMVQRHFDGRRRGCDQVRSVTRPARRSRSLVAQMGAAQIDRSHS